MGDVRQAWISVTRVVSESVSECSQSDEYKEVSFQLHLECGEIL